MTALGGYPVMAGRARPIPPFIGTGQNAAQAVTPIGAPQAAVQSALHGHEFELLSVGGSVQAIESPKYQC